MTPRFTPCAGVDLLLPDEALLEPELEPPLLVLPGELVLPVDEVPPPFAGVTDVEPPPLVPLLPLLVLPPPPDE
jgi:hypothetical protein